MKILYFYQYFSTPKGGWGTRAYEFARRWVQAGDSVTVVTTVYDKSDLQTKGILSRQVIDGIEVIVVGIRQSNKHGICRRLFTFGGYAALATWYALTLEADVVISSSPPITAAIPGLIARCFRGKRLVLEVRDLWPDALIEMGLLRNRVAVRLARAFERFAYSRANVVVALSDGIANRIRTSCRIDTIEVVPNAADNDAVAAAPPLQLPEWAVGKQLVVYAGTLGYANQCMQILEMASILKDRAGVSTICILLIGDGRERQALEARAKEMRLDHVRFLGQMSKEEVNSWLCAACCSLLVLRNAPLTASGSPNKLFDALAAGLPVIHNTAGWMKTLIDQERCGISVPPDDPAALAAAVLRLTADPVLMQCFAANARNLARTKFDRELLTRKMHSVLSGSAKTPGSAAAVVPGGQGEVAPVKLSS